MRAVLVQLALAGALFGCSSGGPRGACAARTHPSDACFASYNLASGADDRSYSSAENRARQHQFAEDLGADVIALQEVDLNLPRSGYLDVGRTVAPAGGQYLFAETLEFDGGQYGTALWLSDRIQLQSWTNMALPGDGSEPRAALVAMVVLPCGRMARVVSTHLSCCGPDPVALRARQLQAIAGLHADVVLGDMNQPPAEVEPALSPLVSLSGGAAVDQVLAAPGAGTGWLEPTRGTTDHPWAAVALVDCP
jgi:endonuclease/exonuclease/phosphatase family metal-dependent hydrolase